MKKTIVCHSFPAWDTPYIKSTVELLKQLSKDHRVIMIDYHYTVKDLIFNKYSPSKRLLGMESRIRTIQTDYGTIEVLSTPPVFPINWIKSKKLFSFFAKMNASILGKTITKQLNKLGVEEYTLINAFNPVYGLYLKDTFKPQKSIYYCYDEIAATDWSGKHGEAHEQEFIPFVDEVICTSSKLKADKSALAKAIKFIPNGVNLDVFLSPHKEKAKGKVIGYIGAIDNRIDFELIDYCAKEFTDYEFQFFGPIKTDLPSLPENVVFMGSVEQKALPEKIQNFDVCLIPFVKNKLTEAIYPLKMNEYLAMGKSVVTTHFSDLSDFNKVVEIAEDKEAFLKAIKKSLRYNSRLKVQQRIDFATENSWANRAKEFAMAI